MSGWIGVDFDGTLATYESSQYPEIGLPIPAMIARVKTWIKDGMEVRIVTARVSAPPDNHIRQMQAARALLDIEHWCLMHIGCMLLACNLRQRLGHD